MLTGKKPQNLYLSRPRDLDALSLTTTVQYAEKTPTIQELQKYIDRIAPDWEKFAVALELVLEYSNKKFCIVIGQLQ